MRTVEALREVVSQSGKSLRSISLDIGRSETFVASSISQAERMGADMNAATVAMIAAGCEYALALVPIGDVARSMVVIDPPT